jgi:uncharacterized protein YdhG (YjbR/CyaY superfamily)
MRTEKAIPYNMDEYIAGIPKDTQTILEELRMTIRLAAPYAKERISYRMPSFYLKGNLVYFAAYKNHIGFYPTASGIEAFREELAVYKRGKGSVQFPISEPLPLNLIADIVKYRVYENLERATAKTKKLP